MLRPRGFPLGVRRAGRLRLEARRAPAGGVPFWVGAARAGCAATPAAPPPRATSTAAFAPEEWKEIMAEGHASPGTEGAPVDAPAPCGGFRVDVIQLASHARCESA